MTKGKFRNKLEGYEMVHTRNGTGTVMILNSSKQYLDQTKEYCLKKHCLVILVVVLGFIIYILNLSQFAFK